MRITRIPAMLLVAIAGSVPATAHAQAQVAQPAHASATPQDPAADVLLKRYESASDPSEAQRVFDELKALAAKSPRAAYLCGMLAAQSGGVVADRAIAMRCLEDAAKAGIAEAQHRLATLLLAERKYSSRAEAQRWLTLAAMSLPESVYLLALLTAEQQPNAEDARRVVVEKAAKLGYPPAQFEWAGRLHATGTAENKSVARALLEQAAAKGHGDAAAELALLLEDDRLERDIPRIVSLLEQASSAGSARGDYALGMRLLEAKGVKRDTERAFTLIKRSAATGYIESQYALGFMLSHGLGTGSDEAAALAWFRRTAAHGHAPSMLAIGNAYANGWGVGKSMDLAYQWYCKSAQAGNASATELVKRNQASDCALPAGSDRR